LEGADICLLPKFIANCPIVRDSYQYNNILICLKCFLLRGIFLPFQELFRIFS
jgi:hypothetical protein